MIVFCVIFTLVCSLRAFHMWLNRNHMFIREVWGKFTSFIFINFQKSELGKFIPNFSLNMWLLLLIYFWFMMPGVNYVKYGCSSARTTPEVSLYRSLTLEENTVAVITQDRVIDNNLKRQIKNQTLRTCRLLVLT